MYKIKEVRLGFFYFIHLLVFEHTYLDKSQVLFPAELNEAGSSSSLPLPVADEGRLEESPRSKETKVPLAGTLVSSGTASVIDENSSL